MYLNYLAGQSLTCYETNGEKLTTCDIDPSMEDAWCKVECASTDGGDNYICSKECVHYAFNEICKENITTNEFVYIAVSSHIVIILLL